MKLMVYGIIACVGLILAPTAGIGAAPPIELDVNVLNTPLPVTLPPDTPMNVNVTNEYQFAGFADDGTAGDVGGLQGMNTICVNEFGDAARMATTTEYFNRNYNNQVVPPPLSAWIRLDVTASTVYVKNDIAYMYVFDRSGYKAPANDNYYSCDSWTSSNAGWSGIAVNSYGNLEAGSCTDHKYVACSLPMGDPLIR